MSSTFQLYGHLNEKYPELVTGNPNAHPPWEYMGDYPEGMLYAEHIPEGFIFKDPTQVKTGIPNLLRHLRNQQSIDKEPTFFFKNVIINNKLEPAQYTRDFWKANMNLAKEYICRKTADINTDTIQSGDTIMLSMQQLHLRQNQAGSTCTSEDVADNNRLEIPIDPQLQDTGPTEASGFMWPPTIANNVTTIKATNTSSTVVTIAINQTETSLDNQTEMSLHSHTMNFIPSTHQMMSWRNIPSQPVPNPQGYFIVTGPNGEQNVHFSPIMPFPYRPIGPQLSHTNPLDQVMLHRNIHPPNLASLEPGPPSFHQMPYSTGQYNGSHPF